MIYDSNEQIDSKHKNNQDYNKKKNNISIFIGLLFVMISFILTVVSLLLDSNKALLVCVIWLAFSLIGTCCCTACEDESDNHKQKYTEQMQNQFYKGTPIITQNDQQHLQQNKQPLIQNQQYIQYPNHLPIIYFPQMYQNQQNGYLPNQQQNYQQQDPLIYQQQPPYQYINSFPAQTVKVEKQQLKDQATQTT